MDTTTVNILDPYNLCSVQKALFIHYHILIREIVTRSAKRGLIAFPSLTCHNSSCV